MPAYANILSERKNGNRKSGEHGGKNAKKERLKELFDEGMRRGEMYILTSKEPEGNGADIDALTIGGDDGWEDFDELYEYLEDFEWFTDAAVEGWSLREI